jgi:hypothetical protein
MDDLLDLLDRIWYDGIRQLPWWYWAVLTFVLVR